MSSSELLHHVRSVEYPARSINNHVKEYFVKIFNPTYTMFTMLKDLQ